MPWQPQNVGCKKRSYIACFIQNVLARLQDVLCTTKGKFSFVATMPLTAMAINWKCKPLLGKLKKRFL